ncbi:unnamed protein product [Fructobacillus fructosus]|uniref:Uncharacterized protein n=1 Tax=Fructobacillus fructosus TaxID=1631 RepID=A0ABN9YLS1_9LACO|nr:unnamed protein product [Fructobacillus fructosus]CAK1234515.1 unnamed protein product [Fructobacillus fructosus]
MDKKTFDERFYKTRDRVNDFYNDEKIQELREEFNSTYGEFGQLTEQDFYIWYTKRHDDEFLYNLFLEFFVD